MSFFIRYCAPAVSTYYQAETGPTTTFANARLFTLQADADAFIAAHGMCAVSFTDAILTVNVTSGTQVIPPDNVTTFLTVEGWGGGGGGCTGAAVNGRPGGGGGAYSKIVNLPVTPGVPITVAIGTAGGAGIPGGNGGDTSVAAGVTLLAKGGVGGPNNDATFGTGGLASAGVGTTKFSGGDGAPRTGASGGGGGSSGGTAANGNPGVGIVGGAAVAGGGAGGDHALDGAAPGGAGGGGDGLGAAGNGVGGKLTYTYRIGT